MKAAEHRRAADRRRFLYPSDLTDGEVALVEPLIHLAMICILLRRLAATTST